MSSNKESSSYSKIPTAEPLIDGAAISSRHAVTVILDEKAAQPDPRYEDAPGYGKGSMLDSSRRPVNLAMCPHCRNHNVRTRTRTYPNAGTWAGVVVGAIICFPVCWVPLVVDSMKQTDHYCQACGKKIGTVKPLEGCCVKEQV